MVVFRFLGRPGEYNKLFGARQEEVSFHELCEEKKRGRYINKKSRKCRSRVSREDNLC